MADRAVMRAALVGDPGAGVSQLHLCKVSRAEDLLEHQWGVRSAKSRCADFPTVTLRPTQVVLMREAFASGTVNDRAQRRRHRAGGSCCPSTVAAASTNSVPRLMFVRLILLSLTVVAGAVDRIESALTIRSEVSHNPSTPARAGSGRHVAAGCWDEPDRRPLRARVRGARGHHAA